MAVIHKFKRLVIVPITVSFKFPILDITKPEAIENIRDNHGRKLNICTLNTSPPNPTGLGLHIKIGML